MPDVLQRSCFRRAFYNKTIPNYFLQNAVFAEPTDEMVVVKDIEMFR